MKLSGVEIIAMQGGTEGLDVVRYCCGEITDRNVEAMDKVNIRLIRAQ